MPAATDLIIKNNAGTDKTFSLITPAAGDGGIAEWALKEGTISGVFPRITASARQGSKSRIMKVKLYVPSSFNDSVTGLTNVGSRAEFNGTWTLPDDFPEASKPDFVAYVKNSIATALFTAMAKDAIPAT